MYGTVFILGAVCGKLDWVHINDKKLNTSGKISVAAIVGDAFISITALVVGILGVVGILHGIPPAAAYTLIGLSGFITLTWIVLTVLSQGEIFTGSCGVPALLKAAFSLDPNCTNSKN